MNTMNTLKANVLGNKLYEYRTMRNMSTEELAQRSGLKQFRIELIEKGSQLPGDDTIKILARALDVPESAFLVFGIDNVEELMRIFFEIETKFGLYPDCAGSRACLRFKETEAFKLCVEPLLKEWDDARKNPTNYPRWKAEFTANDRAAISELRERNRQLVADNNYLMNRVKELEKQLAETVKDRNSALIGKSRAEVDDNLKVFEPADKKEREIFASIIEKAKSNDKLPDDFMEIPECEENEVKTEKTKRGRSKKDIDLGDGLPF